MPNRPRRRCPRYPCPHAQPCPIHHRKTTEQRSNYADLYESPAWRALAKEVLDEERFCPGWHKLGNPIRCGAPTTQADHVTALEDGGAPLDRANVQGLCASCHGRKSATERANRRQARRG